MSILYKLIKHPHWGWRIFFAAGIAAWGLLAWLIFAAPAAAQRAPGMLPDGVDLVLNCGSLKGNGTAVVKIYGRTFALLAINCERT